MISRRTAFEDIEDVLETDGLDTALVFVGAFFTVAFFVFVFFVFELGMIYEKCEKNGREEKVFCPLAK